MGQLQSHELLLQQALETAYQNKLPLLPDAPGPQGRPSAPTDRPTSEMARTPSVPAAESEPSHALALADLIAFGEATATSGMPDFKKLARFQASMEKATPDQIVQLIAEFQGKELKASIKAQMAQMLFSTLSDKDPALALAHADILDDEVTQLPMKAQQLSNAFGRYLKKDSVAALAWLDKQVADGKLENKSLSRSNQARIRLEMQYQKLALLTDLPGARRRLQNLPIDERLELLSQGFEYPNDKPSQAAFLQLLEGDMVPANKRAVIISTYAQYLNEETLANMSDFMRSAKLTRPEEDTMMRYVVTTRMRNHAWSEKTTAEVINEAQKMHDWVRQHRPEDMNKLMDSAWRLDLSRNSPPFSETEQEQIINAFRHGKTPPSN